MERFLTYLIIGLVIIAVTGPMVILVINAAMPAVVITAVVVVALRLVWYFTSRW